MKKKKHNIEDHAWFLHLESIRKMEEVLCDDIAYGCSEEELQYIIKYIGYQTNRAKA